jgi:uncharacterized membrane protein HdeD (DUF308 family)
MVSTETATQTINKASPWLIGWGVVVFVCGVLAVTLPITFSIGIWVVIGCLTLAAAIGHFVFAFHTRNIGGLFWQALIGLLYLIATGCLLVNPLLGVLSLALFVAIFLLLEGIFELALYVQLRRFRHAFWLLLDGIGTVILGSVMLTQWPPASPDIIGTLIGISMILSATSRVIFSLAVRALNPSPA